MGLPAEKRAAAVRQALDMIQKGGQRRFHIMGSEGEGTDVVQRQRKKIMVIDWGSDPNAKQAWENLHNDPKIEVVSERDMNVKVGVKTIIRYIETIEEKVDADLEEIWPS